MQSVRIGEFVVSYNPNFSGAVRLEKDGDASYYTVPFSVLKCIVAAWVQNERVRRVANEDDANKILLPDVPLFSLHK